MKEELHKSILFSSFIELISHMKGNGTIASHMDMERIIILMEDTTKELLLKGYHMDLEDLSMEMGIIMKARSNMEEEMVKEFTILEELFLEDYSRIMY